MTISQMLSPCTTLPSTQSMHVLKSDGASTQPCLIPVFTGKKLDTPPPHLTALTVPEYRPVNRSIILAGIPQRRRRTQSVSRCTERTLTAQKGGRGGGDEERQRGEWAVGGRGHSLLTWKESTHHQSKNITSKQCVSTPKSGCLNKLFYLQPCPWRGFPFHRFMCNMKWEKEPLYLKLLSQGKLNVKIKPEAVHGITDHKYWTNEHTI